MSMRRNATTGRITRRALLGGAAALAALPTGLEARTGEAVVVNDVHTRLNRTSVRRLSLVPA